MKHSEHSGPHLKMLADNCNWKATKAVNTTLPRQRGTLLWNTSNQNEEYVLLHSLYEMTEVTVFEDKTIHDTITLPMNHSSVHNSCHNAVVQFIHF